MVARYNRLAESRLRSRDREDQMLETDTLSGMADIAAAVERVQSIRPVPVQLWAVLPLTMVSLAPMLAVATLMVPIPELAKRVFGALL